MEPVLQRLVDCARELARARFAALGSAALERGYLWHEFGDSHLILP